MLRTLLTRVERFSRLVSWRRKKRDMGCWPVIYFRVVDLRRSSFWLRFRWCTCRWRFWLFVCRRSVINDFIKISTIIFVVISKDCASNVFSTIRARFRLVTARIQVFLHFFYGRKISVTESTAKGFFQPIIVLEWRQSAMRVPNGFEWKK